MTILPKSARLGFTLIELLVVITIIAILIALSLSATMRVISIQEQGTTESVIVRVQSVLDKQWQAVIDKANREPVPANIVTAAGGDAQRGRVIWIKLRLKQEFPMSKAEALNPAPLPPLPTYQGSLAGVTFPDALTENSACLLMALSQSRDGITLNPEDLGTLSGQVGSTGMRTVLDGWGKPIVFFRWPTGNAEVDATNPATPNSTQATFRDPQDPSGLLLNATWWNSPNRPQFESWCHSLHQTGRPHAFYMMPVLASGGKDRRLGAAFPDMATANAVDAQDDIYSYRVKP